MKIKNLNLIRYGHFEDRDLEFTPDKLTIIYGPNEAGKSTSLSAIADLLYGFDHSCPYDFRHQPNQLRVGATVINNAGEELTVIRRKGRGNTLLAVDESSLPDSVLSPFLGQSTKDFFQKSFGLSHERLREGGDAIGRADGDLGQILFEAGSGITSLAEVQSLLGEEADTIFGPRKSEKRALYQSIDAYNAAQSALKEASLKRADWVKAQTELTEAAAALDDARKYVNTLSNRQTELNRWREVLVLLSDLDRLRNELKSLGRETALPGDAREKLSKALEQRRHGGDLIAQTEDRIEQNVKELADLTIDEALLSANDAIMSLYENASAIEQQLTALPGIETTIASLNKRIEELVERFELPQPDGKPYLPPHTSASKLAALISEGQTLDREIESAKAAEISATVEIEQLHKELQSLGNVGDPRADIAVLQTLRAGIAGLPDKEKLQRDQRKHEKKINDSLASLPWWSGSAESLLAANLPSVALVEQHKKVLERTRKILDSAVDKLEVANKDLAIAEHRLADYSKRETLYTHNDLSNARAIRQDAWHLVRQVLEGKPAPGEDELTPFNAGDSLVPVYETLTERADSIADIRFSSMEEIVEHNRLQREVSDKNHAVELAKQKFETASADHDAQGNEWKSIWESAGVAKPDQPDVMKDGLTILSGIGEAVSALDEIAAEIKALEKKTRWLHGELTKLANHYGTHIDAEEVLDIAATRLQFVLDKQSELYTGGETLRARIADRQRVLDRVQKDNVTLVKRQHDWREQWQSCCSEVNLSSNTSAQDAREINKAWDELRQVVRDLNRAEAEYEQAETVITQFQSSVKVMTTEVGSTESITTPSYAITTVRKYHKQLIAMQRLVTKRESIEKQLAEHKSSLDKFNESAIRADGEIKTLLELAAVPNEADLPAAIGNAESSKRLKSEIANAQQRLLLTSEGETEDALRNKSAGLTRETIKDELDSLVIAIDSANAARDEATRRDEQAKRAVADLASKAGAGSHAQAAENAAARMEEQSRDYLRLQAASILLRHGIERIREKHKSPILTKGSEFFAALTAGSFKELKTDYDKSDNPTIVGIRDDNQRVYVNGMSDGTRDQLYLALRLAFIENYCSKEEPLPFIADDLFVHFDEPRAKAGLRLLSQLPECQVIMFTHHEHVCQIAAEVLEEEASIMMLSSAVESLS